MSRSMKKKIVFLPYDFDTAIGINNEGSLVFSYNLEDIDQTAGGADVFNGQQSILWKNLREMFPEELKSMYQTLRSRGVISYARIENAFEAHQGKWPEAIFNEDAWFKYLAPLEEKGSAAYLAMLQGSKAEQRKWWLYNRFKYIDSKYNAGESLTDVITLRGYAKSNITLTPYADVYCTVKFGSYLVQQRGERNHTYEMVCPLDNVNDTEIYIYSASQLADVGDLSGLKVGYAEFVYATKLRQLILGSNESGYSNGNLQTLYLGNNKLLRRLDVRNCTSIPLGGFSGTDALEDAELPEVLALNAQSFMYSGIGELTLPKCAIMNDSAQFNYCASLRELRLPVNTSVFANTSYSGGSLETLDLGLAASIGTNFNVAAFAKLKNLILRNTSQVATAYSATMFRNGSPLKAGTGLILVPRALVNSYKADSKWSGYSSMIEAIEDHADICG